MKTKKIIYQIILMGVFIAILSGCKNDEDSIGSMELTGTTWTSDNGKYCIGFTTSNSAIRYDSNLGIKRGVYTIQNDHIFLDLGGGNIVDMIYENKAITGIEEKLFVLKKDVNSVKSLNLPSSIWANWGDIAIEFLPSNKAKYITYGQYITQYEECTYTVDGNHIIFNVAGANIDYFYMANMMIGNDYIIEKYTKTASSSDFNGAVWTGGIFGIGFFTSSTAKFLWIVDNNKVQYQECTYTTKDQHLILSLKDGSSVDMIYINYKLFVSYNGNKAVLVQSPNITLNDINMMIEASKN